jgi:outer membrane protein OmpA-like peptidoglycan-associated protein
MIKFMKKYKLRMQLLLLISICITSFSQTLRKNTAPPFYTNVQGEKTLATKTFLSDTLFLSNGEIRGITEFSLTKTLNGVLVDSTVLKREFWDCNGLYVGYCKYRDKKTEQCIYFCNANLVTNGSFEYSTKDRPDCPNSTSVNGWPVFSITGGPHKSVFSAIPDSIKAFSGNSFAEITLAVAYFPDNCIRYVFLTSPIIENKLALPVIKGQRYTLSLWVKRNPFSKFKYGELKVYLLEHPLDAPCMNKSALLYYPDIEKYSPQLILDRSYNKISGPGWQKITITFKAKKTSNYLVIGNLDPIVSLSEKSLSREDLEAFNYKKKKSVKVISNDDWRTKHLFDENPYLLFNDSINNYSFDYRFMSNLYIDNVSLTALNCTEQKTSPQNRLIPVTDTVLLDNIAVSFEDSTTIITPQTTYVLNNVLFYFNSSELQPSSFAELDILYGILLRNPDFSVEISGHTDSIGNEGYNLVLSEERAKSVAGYLIKKGIDPNRILYKGYGSNMPLGPNNTEGGRTANRRVEFKIINR